MIARLPYVLGLTTVIFRKHIHKLAIDREKRIFTLPVLVSEKAACYAVLAMIVVP